MQFRGWLLADRVSWGELCVWWGQVNPLAETEDGILMAADAKLGFDDNAAYRQKELFAKRDPSQEDPR